MSGQVRTIEDLRGPAGRLEAVMNTGTQDALYAAVVAHPHPLYGGTMHNKVVYHAAKAFNSFGLPTLRFNFRGVGLSEGEHANGSGEIDDVRAAVDWMDREFRLPILFAGFSFGSNIGFRACCGDRRIAGLVGLGLPINAEGREYHYDFLPSCGPIPKLFVIGSEDAYAPREQLERELAKATDPKRTVWVKGADHFFAGTPQSPEPKLGVMSEAVRTWLSASFGL
ncbi:alpha/beta hydrolase [Granulicella cerasi]|uniref:Alpha/beta hydrolase n=1 Tax=Granulicella cerasi TaxID=741063 RepID=A0ABW1Z5Y8_9BACT|nr:alpha/beta family hydrolase [Granulicella cerasi]